MWSQVLRKRLETFQSLTSLHEVLTNEQYQKFEQIINLLINENAVVTYRGENASNLSKKLWSGLTLLPEEKITSLLFYYGDKAKHFYCVEDKEAKKSRWLKNIEDKSSETASIIYEKIKSVLKNKKTEVVDFKKGNPSFSSYFELDNKEHFIKALEENQKYLIDYYLYFLHTAGWIGVGEKSTLVSTSLEYTQAVKFSGEKGFIIYYYLPSPREDFSISYKETTSYTADIIEHELPSYNSVALYPEQDEVAIKGGLFSCFMIGVEVVGENKFIVNPHLFEGFNSIQAIKNGLYIDQSDFEKNLNDTGYYRGCITKLDGYYRTVEKTPR